MDAIVGNLFQFVCLGLATGAASITVAKSKFFTNFREWFSDTTFKEDLINCPYCVSHYIAALFVVVAWPTTGFNSLANFVISWLAVVALGTFVGGLILRAYTLPEEDDD